MKFKQNTSGRVFYFTIFNDFKLFLSQIESKKIDEYEKDAYEFNEIIITTKKTKSSLSYVKTSQLLKLRLPKLHIEFLTIISEVSTKPNTIIDGRNPLFYSYKHWVL